MALPSFLVNLLSVISWGLLIASVAFFLLALFYEFRTDKKSASDAWFHDPIGYLGLFGGRDDRDLDTDEDTDQDTEQGGDTDGDVGPSAISTEKVYYFRCFLLLALTMCVINIWELAKVPYFLSMHPMTNKTYDAARCLASPPDPMCYGVRGEVHLQAWFGYRGPALIGNPVVFLALHVTLGCLLNTILVVVMLKRFKSYWMHAALMFFVAIIFAIHLLPMAHGFPNNVTGFPVNECLVGLLVLAGIAGHIGLFTSSQRLVTICLVVVAVCVNSGPIGEIFLLLCPYDALPSPLQSDVPLAASGHGLYAQWEENPSSRAVFMGMAVVALLGIFVYPIIFLAVGSDVVPVVRLTARNFRLLAFSWFCIFICVSLQNYNGPAHWFPFTGQQSELAVLNWAYPKDHAKCQEYLGPNKTFLWCYTTGVMTYSFPDREDRILPGSPGPFPLTNIMTNAVDIGADMTSKFMTINMLGAAQQFMARRDTVGAPAWQRCALKAFWPLFVLYWLFWIYFFNCAIATAEAFPTFCALYVPWLWSSDRSDKLQPSTLSITLSVAFYLFFPSVLKPTTLSSAWAFTFADVISANLSNLGWWPNNVNPIQALYDIGTQTLAGNFGFGLQMYHDAGWVAIAAGFYVVLQGVLRAGVLRQSPIVALAVFVIFVPAAIVYVALGCFYLAYLPFVLFIVYECFVGNSLLAFVG